MWVSVSGIIGPPLIGLGFTGYRTTQVFQAYSVTSSIADAEALAIQMREAYHPTFLGLAVSAVFFVLFILSWLRLRVARVEWEDQLVNGHKKAGAVRLQLL